MMELVVFVLALTVYEIFSNQIKCLNGNLGNEGQDQGGENVIDVVRLEIFKSIFVIFFFRIVATLQPMLMQKEANTDMGDDYKQNLRSRFAENLMVILLE